MLAQKPVINCTTTLYNYFKYKKGKISKINIQYTKVKSLKSTFNYELYGIIIKSCSVLTHTKCETEEVFFMQYWL